MRFHLSKDFFLALALLDIANSFITLAPPPPPRQSHVAPVRKHSLQSVLQLHAIHPHQVDMDVTFGSSNNTGVNWGYEEDDLDDEDNDRKKRKETLEKLMQQQDLDFKEERRQKKWGKFANATTKEEIRTVERAMRDKISKENARKVQVAKAQGMEIEVLEPQDKGVYDDNDNIHIVSANDQASKNWFNKVDKDLEQEWEAMEAGNELIADGQKDSTDAVRVKGKLVSREVLQGVRVGSAGGWSLEVFPGDFVVHRKYGIGRFEGTCVRPKSKLTPEEQHTQDERRAELLTAELKKFSGGVTPEEIKIIRSKFGTEEDTDPISNPQSTVLEITYLDGIVHVPVDRAYRISRYRAGDAVIKPKLSKVKGDAWRKAKRKVEECTLQLAQDVLALYATREILQRQPFDPSLEYLGKEFDESFAYEPTQDQLKCFEDIENDMVWRSRPMDRLVCGDVGFGKTEVAMRALYRTVVNGKQGVLLAPTGVLAAQHYKNVMKRMGEGTKFNQRIALLRGGMGRNTKVGLALREKIANGEVDLVVGTHALLSNDLKYKNLGLLVVDEEQRFGVKQKERLKLICGGVDVLTLTATPIPRTLQMALSGIRDTSTIKSAPPMRKPTITYVQDFNEDIIKLAVSLELERDGQCYYVVPRINMLEEAEKLLIRLFPGVEIIQAHGRMQRGGAEENVAAFAEGKFKILLATTVIENGVDIPRVNTIIIQNSQAFGMSTLYQLRGRVGRSDKQAYAYFLHREESITEQAALRLQAIGELVELGSGFDVANRDLEIRGAGSLLGTEQSGTAAKVGFDLYMRMLKKSIRKLRGLDLPLVPRTNVLLPKQEGSMEIRKKSEDGVIRVHSFRIPESYIPDEDDRRSQETAARLAESTSKLVDLTNGWKDNYGTLPAALQNKLKTMHLHACTRQLGIDLIGLVDMGEGRYDCVLRSPGLRPRHWAVIISMLPKGVPTKGLDVIFPARFTLSGNEEEVIGGLQVDLKTLLEDSSSDEDSENWDALDEEEVEAMKVISSAYNVEDLDEIEIEQYPRFVIKNFGKEPKAVDRLLKVLLLSAKVVYEKQEADKEEAKMAAGLREKRELLLQRKKTNDAAEEQRSWMK
jgi:transcription-repair coupling factor (superfamily II helicase)